VDEDWGLADVLVLEAGLTEAVDENCKPAEVVVVPGRGQVGSLTAG
jgi:hypothetical protein